MGQEVVVIGAGFGGIAAALRARSLGYEVTLVEKLTSLGGRAGSICVDNYHYDTGPTVITAPWLFDELFALFGKRRADYIEFIALDIWYRFHFNDGDRFDYQACMSQTLADIARIHPPDVAGYQSLLAESKRIYEVGFDQLACEPFHRLTQMLRTVPDMLRLRSHQSVWQRVCNHLQSDKLRQAFSIQPLLVGGNPFDTTCIYSLIHYLERLGGIHFARGGTAMLVRALERLMREEGIRIVLGQKVEEIILTRGKVSGVRCSDGYFSAQHVIANTDPAFLYSKLLNKRHVASSAKLKNRFARKSMALFVVFFGTTRQYPDVAHHSIVLGPRYRELLDDIFNKQVLTDDFSIYLHRPTATDPSLAPAGCDSFYALVPVANNQSGIDWDTAADGFSQSILKHLERTLLPGLRQHLAHSFYHTPNDFQSTYLSPDGAGFSIAPLFYQSAWFRYHNRGEGPKNLYLVGAGTHPGAGLPGVLCSAKVVEKLLS